MEATGVPLDIMRTAPGREGAFPAAEAFAAGIGAIASAPTVHHVHRATHELAIRLPRVHAVAILHRDDAGLLAVAYNPEERVPRDRAAMAASALHRHWISAHAAGGAGPGVRPVIFDPSSELSVVPIVRGDALLGAILLDADGDQPLADLPTVGISLGAIGVVVSQALANLVLRHRLRSTVSTAEHEAALTTQAKALGRKLHDGPAQLLALLGMALDRQVRVLGPDAPACDDARQARDLLDRAVDGMRQCMTAMRQGVMLHAAPSMTGPLRALVGELDPETASLEVEFDGVSGVQLTPEVEQALVGITREALHNVRKHAQAEMVRLEVHRIGSEVELVIHDDGVGFDGAAPPGHFGLEQIRELAEETGGRIEIASSVGQGTEVRARIPIAHVGSGVASDGAACDRI